MPEQLIIVSGGQTGVDRAALDVAIDCRVPYSGWCPQGGLAEDFPDPPGLLADYPDLQETPSQNYLQRTEWNVKDSDATLIVAPNWIYAHCGGTGITIEYAAKHAKPCLIIYPSLTDAVECTRQWLATMGKRVVLNVAGPRASKAPSIYEETRVLLEGIIAGQ